MQNPNSGDALKAEMRMYASLKHLQGRVIPTLHGYYEVWGILHLLALEPVGHAISEDRIIIDALRHKMKAALRRIHAAGYLHGDISRRNFCKKGDKVFMIDLEQPRVYNSVSERLVEEQLVDSLS
jgi:tRNA A-37 threonylcarbamoyl transferase component Bud32